MINIFRVVMALFLVLVSQQSFAIDYFWTHQQSTAKFNGPDAACKDLLARMIAIGNVTAGAVPGGASTYQTEDRRACRYSKPPDPNTYGLGSVYRGGDTCAAPKVLDPVTLVCDVPPPPTCVKDQLWVVVGALKKTPTNHRGCAVSLVAVLKCYSVPNGTYCKYEVKNTGALAGPDDPPTVEAPGHNDEGPRVKTPELEMPPNSKCPAGTVQAGVTASGTPICVGVGTESDNPKPPTTKTWPSSTGIDPQGNTNTQNMTDRTNVDGSVTRTITTKIVTPDGITTVTGTTSTSKAMDGSEGVADTEDGGGFCKRNSTLTICKNSTVTGTCEAVSCSGDAIQCATLRAVSAQECRDKTDRDDIAKSSITALGEAASAGNDPQRGDFASPQNARVVDVSTTLNSDGFLSGRACFADKTVTVMGKAIVLPFSKVCDALLALRFVMMIIASLISFRILSGAILR